MEQVVESSSLEIQVSVASDRTATVSLANSPKQHAFSTRLTLRNILSNIDNSNAQQILIGIAAGMKHLHDHALAHMDLTDSNIIVEQNGSVSIINLGKSRNFANNEPKATEKQQENSTDAKSDVFSFGLLMDEIFSKKPSNETNRRSDYSKAPSYVPHSYAGLYVKCLNKSAAQRPTFTRILDELQGMEFNLSFKSLSEKSVYRPPKNEVNLDRFKGIIPAFYACYDDNGQVDKDRTIALAKYLFGIDGIVGLYVGGSSGEGIYQTVDERKKVLEWVVEAKAQTNKVIIAHVGCNNTRDSVELARHAQEQRVDAIASIPPIYFHLPEYSIAEYWTSISKGAPATPFIIYNIPQLAGVNLTKSLLRSMFEKCPTTLIGVKNSSSPTQDIQMWREVAMEYYGDEVDNKFIVFNGPDEQLVSGLIIGANGAIGGTYASMPKLFVKAYQCVLGSPTDNTTAMNLQNDICRIIYKFGEARGNLYSIMKEVIKIRQGLDCGDVRAPLVKHTEEDMNIIREAKNMIDEAEKKYGLD